MSLLARIAQRFAPQPVPLALPPVQEERFDGWANSATGLGGRNDRATCNTFLGRLGRTDEELQATYDHSALMARFIDLEPNTCMAKGFQISELSGDDVTAFEHEMLRLNAFCHIGDGRRWARLYCGALVFMLIHDGRKASEPVDEANIVNVQSLTTFDRREVSVVKWCDEFGSDNFGFPEVYRITSMGKMFDVHCSRVLRFDAVKVNRYSLRHGTGHGFGSSIVDQVWDAFEQYGTTHAYLNGAVSKITQGVLKLKNLSVGATGSNWQKISNRLKSLMRSMSVIGDVVLDADGEEYSMVERPMTGFSEAAAVSEARLVGDMGVPKSLLMMQAPGGLSNGDNGGDWQYWSVHCGSEQQQTYEPQCKKLVRLIFLSRNCPVIDPPQTFTITWPPIMQMTERQKAEIYQMRAAARSTDIPLGVVNAIEARKSEDVIESYHLDADPSGDYSEPADASVPPELRIVGT